VSENAVSAGDIAASTPGIDVEAEPVAPAASPCNSICRMNSATGWCEGCLRTLDEIAAWASLDDVDRRRLLMRLAEREARRSIRGSGELPKPAIPS
jgi:predicted Fe-S protein YdhL (DUF1289 family)